MVKYKKFINFLLLYGQHHSTWEVHHVLVCSSEPNCAFEVDISQSLEMKWAPGNEEENHHTHWKRNVSLILTFCRTQNNSFYPILLTKHPNGLFPVVWWSAICSFVGSSVSRSADGAGVGATNGKDHPGVGEDQEEDGDQEENQEWHLMDRIPLENIKVLTKVLMYDVSSVKLTDG